MNLSNSTFAFRPPYPEKAISSLDAHPIKKQPSEPNFLQFEDIALEPYLGSVLVLTSDNEVIYSSQNIEGRLTEAAKDPADGISGIKEVELICQVLKQSRLSFPNQNWAIEFDILTKESSALHIRSRWLKLSGYDKPCILLVVEDRQQLVQDMVLDEVQDWGLTPREQEVWLLHQDGYTRNEIAEKLYITINTVKKHMRSIHSKRRAHPDASVN